MVGDCLYDFWVPVAEQAGHLAGCEVQHFLSGGCVHVEPSAATDHVFVEFGSIVEEVLCCFGLKFLLIDIIIQDRIISLRGPDCDCGLFCGDSRGHDGDILLTSMTILTILSTYLFLRTHGLFKFLVPLIGELGYFLLFRLILAAEPRPTGVLGHHKVLVSNEETLSC